MKKLAALLVLLAACDKPSPPAPPPGPMPPTPPPIEPTPKATQPDVPKEMPLQPGDLAGLGWPKDSVLHPRPSAPGDSKADLMLNFQRVGFYWIRSCESEEKAKDSLRQTGEMHKSSGAKVEAEGDTVKASFEFGEAGQPTQRAVEINVRVGSKVIQVGAAGADVAAADLWSRAEKTLALIRGR